jgi:hypothetical protein
VKHEEILNKCDTLEYFGWKMAAGYWMEYGLIEFRKY